MPVRGPRRCSSNRSTGASRRTSNGANDDRTAVETASRGAPGGDRGDYASIQITAAEKKVADGWDRARDGGAGARCKAYGAPAIMRVPTGLRITWQDENTLKIETENGTQTRLFHFGAWTPGHAVP